MEKHKNRHKRSPKVQIPPEETPNNGSNSFKINKPADDVQVHKRAMMKKAKSHLPNFNFTEKPILK